MAYRGKYKPRCIYKYKGDPTKIVYRSLWELKFMKYCDSNTNILEWGSEEIVLPYRSPIDNKVHRYYPDFYIKVRETNRRETMMEWKNMKKKPLRLKSKKRTNKRRNPEKQKERQWTPGPMQRKYTHK